MLSAPRPQRWHLVSLLACACAATLPPHLSDPDHSAPPACPRDTHLSAVGQSKQGREAAVASAKKNLLTKLGNSIHVEVESFSRLASKNGAESSEFREIARVLEHVDFAHSDLIEIAGSPARDNGETYVVACMRRDLAREALERDLGVEVKAFDTWDNAATEAQARSDRPAFVAALGHLSSAMAKAAPTLVQIRALAGGPASVEQHLTSRWLVLVKASTELRAQLRFVLDMQLDPRVAAIASDVTEAFRKALTPLAARFALQPRVPRLRLPPICSAWHADAECRLGSLGPTCRLVLDVSGRECASGRQVFRSGLDRVQAMAMDTRGEDRAMRKMAQKIDPKQIGLALQSVLKSELPGSENP